MGLSDLIGKAIDVEKILDEKALIDAAGDRLEAILERGIIVDATVKGVQVHARISLGMGTK